jgi:hypothetical protein
MSRENIIQVSLNDTQLELARKQAKARGIPLATWARWSIFSPHDILVKGFAVEGLEQAKQLMGQARKLRPEEANPDPAVVREDIWDLLFMIRYRSFSSGGSLIAEVLDAHGVHGRYSDSWTRETRFVLNGGPWLHAFEEDLSFDTNGDRTTVVRLSVRHDENFYKQ